MKLTLVYRGRSTSKFVFGGLYRAEVVLAKARGSKSEPLDVMKLSDGYRITPYEFRKFWKHVNVSQLLNFHFFSIYCRDMKIFEDLLYAENPFLALARKKQA